MTSRRSIPEKLLVVPIENESVIKIIGDLPKTIDVKVILTGRSPEGEPQPNDGDKLTIIRGGRKVNIGDIELTQIDYKQILYIHPND